jgi:hypothetical protein
VEGGSGVKKATSNNEALKLRDVLTLLVLNVKQIETNKG